MKCYGKSDRLYLSSSGEEEMIKPFGKTLIQNLQSGMYCFGAILHRHPHICIAPVTSEAVGTSIIQINNIAYEMTRMFYRKLILLIFY